jgi:ADP-ribose pyrophosphatase
MAESQIPPNRYPVAMGGISLRREIEFSPREPTQIYHAVTQLDYLAIVALTPDGRFPIVRQYRPALEMFTWELPAGLAELDEDAAEGCKRELLEETGYPTRDIHLLGTAAPCSGRLGNLSILIFANR